ncbi:hypothetical protein Dimus_038725 [Dionaea muscipula]
MPGFLNCPQNTMSHPLRSTVEHLLSSVSKPFHPHVSRVCLALNIFHPMEAGSVPPRMTFCLWSGVCPHTKAHKPGLSRTNPLRVGLLPFGSTKLRPYPPAIRPYTTVSGSEWNQGVHITLRFFRLFNRHTSGSIAVISGSSADALGLSKPNAPSSLADVVSASFHQRFHIRLIMSNIYRRMGYKDFVRRQILVIPTGSRDARSTSRQPLGVCPVQTNSSARASVPATEEEGGRRRLGLTSDGRRSRHPLDTAVTAWSAVDRTRRRDFAHFSI